MNLHICPNACMPGAAEAHTWMHSDGLSTTMSNSISKTISNISQLLCTKDSGAPDLKKKDLPDERPLLCGLKTIFSETVPYISMKTNLCARTTPLLTPFSLNFAGGLTWQILLHNTSKQFVYFYYRDRYFMTVTFYKKRTCLSENKSFAKDAIESGWRW